MLTERVTYPVALLGRAAFAQEPAQGPFELVACMLTETGTPEIGAPLVRLVRWATTVTVPPGATSVGEADTERETKVPVRSS